MACSGVEWQRPRLAAGPALAALERWVDRRYTTILALWLVTIGAWCVVVSAHKPLSNDEVFVVWSAGQASIPDIWRGLVAGVNQDPPLVHVVAHYLFQLLGRSATVARMPGMAGFLMTLAFCALTVRGRVSPLLSLVPLFLPLAAACTPYATEARPYGWLLGCTSLAVYSWSRIWRSQSPKRWLLLHAMSLAAALASQFFAIYLAIPFACGGAMAAAQRRKSWRPALCATAAALSSVVLWLPIMRGISKYSGHHFSPASISGLRAFYRDIFPDAVLGIGVFLLCLAVARFLNLAEHRRDEVPAGECGSTDAALLIGFLMIPVAALGVGLLITKTLHTRYLLFSLVGWFIGIPMVADAIGGARRSLAASVVAACLAPAGLAMRESARFEYPDRYTLGQIGQIQRMVPDRGETIIPRANLYLTLQYYGEPRPIDGIGRQPESERG